MKISSSFISICLLLVSVTCAHQSQRKTVAHLSLQNMIKLSPGVDGQEETLKFLGPPHSKDSYQQKVVWAYSNDDLAFSLSYPNAIVRFDRDSGKITSLTWLTRSTQPEKDLKMALGLFKNAHFAIKEGPWLTDHTGPDQEFYEDEKSGIRIVYLPGPREVESITISVPHAQNSVTEKIAKPNM